MAEADPDEPVAPLLERADTALYDAKRSGRNCTRFLRRDKSTEPTGRADTPGSLVAGSLPDVRSNSAFLPDAIGSQSLSHTGSAPPLEKSLA